MIESFVRISMASFLVVLVFPDRLHSQAYCALRDPVTAIHSFYPQKTSYRSIVRVVSRKNRDALSRELNFTLHFSELGKHTLYVAFQEHRPIGLVHVRSEKGKWGLVEVTWALDLDLRVRGFQFQRCRSRQRGTLEDSAFAKQLVGKSLAGLKNMLSEDGQSLRHEGIEVPEGAEELALTVLRSAAKTVAVTQEAWARDLNYLRVLSRACGEFDRATKVKPIAPIYTSRVREVLTELSQEEESVLLRGTVRLYSIHDERDETLGLMVRAGCSIAQSDLVFLWWIVDEANRIVSITPEDTWPDVDTLEIFQGSKGMSLERVSECSTPAQVASMEILALARVHGK